MVTAPANEYFSSFPATSPQQVNPGDDIRVAKYCGFDKDFLLELEPCSTHVTL